MWMVRTLTLTCLGILLALYYLEARARLLRLPTALSPLINCPHSLNSTPYVSFFPLLLPCVYAQKLQPPELPVFTVRGRKSLSDIIKRNACVYINLPFRIRAFTTLLLDGSFLFGLSLILILFSVLHIFISVVLQKATENL